MQISELRREYMAAHGARFDALIEELADSPIEGLVIGSLLVNLYGRNELREGMANAIEFFARKGVTTCPRTLLDGPAGVFLTHPKVRLSPQVTITPDLVFNSRYCDCTVAVELDGHDFHERTKEQASRDKGRDRGLAKLGIIPIRFTGSDVFRDPAMVERECHAIALAQLNAKAGG